MRRTLPFFVALALAGVTVAAESPQQTFVKAWEGRPVTVRLTLYSLIYNERGKLGTTHSGQHEGLIVVTPSSGAWFQFDGRQGRDEVVQRDLQRVLAAVNKEYEPNTLDPRPYRKVEAIAINRFDPGVTLIISSVAVERDEVRFDFAAPGDEEAVTALRVKMPVPLTRAFNERAVIEGLLRQFVDIRQP